MLEREITLLNAFWCGIDAVNPLDRSSIVPILPLISASVNIPLNLFHMPEAEEALTIFLEVHHGCVNACVPRPGPGPTTNELSQATNYFDQMVVSPLDKNGKCVFI